MIYFSYGSNMSLKRIEQRISSVKKVGVGLLREHTLEFHKVSKDGSAKCDAFETGDPDSKMYGILFDLEIADKGELDKIEGLGHGYDEKEVLIELLGGNIIGAYTYYATHINQDLSPFGWYKEHVLRGAKENNLPLDYISMIEIVESVKDTDIDRHERELSIYR